MAQSDETAHPDPRTDQPTWKDLAEFMSQQAENDRKVIDFWFKLATALLGIVLVFAVGVVGFVGWKTLADAKATAEAAARDAARVRVEDVLKQPELQKLVRETASDLFEKGAFRSQIEVKTKELISAEIATPESRKLIGDAIKRELATRMAPRVLSESQSKAIEGALGSAPGGKVVVRTGNLPEQQGYARKLYSAIKAAPLWKDHVSYAEPGTWAGMTNSTLLLLDGIVVVVNDAAHPPASARLLEAALKSAGVVGVHVGTCECEDSPKAPDIWLYIGEKIY